MEFVLYALTLFFVFGTAVPLLSHDHWVVRVLDFPRVQLTVGMVATLLGFFVLRPASALEFGSMGLLTVCVAYQAVRIFPYTVLAPNQVLWAREETDGTARISLLVANVEMENRDAEAVLERVRTEDPDVLLLLETDEWWAEEMSTLEETYPFMLKHPRSNAYGLCLYSKHRLVDSDIRFMVEEDVPSVHTTIALPSGVEVDFHGMHPRPPHPRHEPDTTERDAEMLLLARELQDRDGLTIVGGDLNDVSWSYTTRLFQRISGLLDPRVGRGLYNTFHARYPLFRYPLDHLLHSDHFTLVQLRVLSHVGSDHFPVFVELQYEPEAVEKQEQPEPDGADEEQTEHELEKLREKRNDTE